MNLVCLVALNIKPHKNGLLLLPWEDSRKVVPVLVSEHLLIQLSNTPLNGFDGPCTLLHWMSTTSARDKSFIFARHPAVYNRLGEKNYARMIF